MPLGSLQKGSFDVSGAVVDIVAVAASSSHAGDVALNGHRNTAPEWLLRIKTGSQLQPIELAVQTKEEAVEWSNTIRYSIFRIFTDSIGFQLKQFITLIKE